MKLQSKYNTCFDPMIIAIQTKWYYKIWSQVMIIVGVCSRITILLEFGQYWDILNCKFVLSIYTKFFIIVKLYWLAFKYITWKMISKDIKTCLS